MVPMDSALSTIVPLLPINEVGAGYIAVAARTCARWMGATLLQLHVASVPSMVRVEPASLKGAPPMHTVVAYHTAANMVAETSRAPWRIARQTQSVKSDASSTGPQCAAWLVALQHRLRKECAQPTKVNRVARHNHQQQHQSVVGRSHYHRSKYRTTKPMKPVRKQPIHRKHPKVGQNKTMLQTVWWWEKAARRERS